MKSVRKEMVSELRRRAEEVLQEQLSDQRELFSDLDAVRMLHELQVHQTELEMQNEELVNSRSALEAALGRFTDFYEFSPVGNFSIDSDGILLRTNMAGANMLGVDRIHLAGRHLDDFLERAGRASFGSFLQRVFAGETQTCEIQVIRTNLPLLDLQISGILSEDMSECRAVAIDISSRKRAEAEREQFNKFFQLSSDFMAIARTTGEFIKVNPASQEILGYSEAELISKQLISFIHPDDKQIVRDGILKQAGLDSSLTFENRFICKDGTICWLAWRAKYDRAEGIAYVTARDVTSNKQSEKALRNASEYNRSLIEASLDPLMTISPNGIITDVNIATESVTGYARTELIGTNFLDYFTQPEQARAGYEQVLREGSVVDYPLEIQHRDGRKISVLYNAALYRDQDGNAIGIFAAARDITERKQVEQITQARVKLLEFSLNHSRAELLTATLDEVEALTGSLVGFYHFLDEDQVTLSLQNWSTRTLAEFCSAAGKNSHYPIDLAGVWADCVRQRKPVIHNDYGALPASERKGLPEGHAQLLRELVVPVFRGKNIVCIFGVGNKPRDYTQADVEIVTQIADMVWDIAERKKTEQALQDSQKLLAQTELIGNVGGWELNIDTGEQTWTDEIYRIHELDKSHHPTLEHGLNFYTPESRPVIEQALQHASREGEAFDLDLEIVTALGNRRWVQVIGKADLKLGRISGFFQDISDRKLIELKLVAAHDRLEQRVAERTAELQTANRALEKALQSRNEFLTAMSHELRTPLTGVLGLSQVLQMQSLGTLTAKQMDAIKAIEQSGKRLLDLINNILDYSVIQSGNLVFERGTCSLGEVCQSALQAVQGAAANKHQQVSFKIKPESILIYASSTRLKQILAHLLNNASKFTAAGASFGMEVTGNLAENLVEITVWDNGIGIKPEDFQYLFKPFVQLDGSLARVYGGTGLGLMLAKSLVELHGGWLEVKSVFGQGSSFIIHLPWQTEPGQSVLRN